MYHSAPFYITSHNKGEMSADLTCLGSPPHWSSLALQYQTNGPGKMKQNTIITIRVT